MSNKHINAANFLSGRLFKKVYRFVKASTRYYSPLTLKYYVFFISCIRCYMKGRFSPMEVFHLGLGTSLLPSNESISKFISYSQMKEIDRILNPMSWLPATSNKGIFYTICKNLRLPMPNLYALIFKDNVSISYLNSSLLKKKDLIKFIRYELPHEFVIKPESGSMGQFINSYTKTNRGMIEASGKLVTEQDIVEKIMNNEKYKCFVVQEKLKNHAYLAKIFPSDSLHNIRLMTLIDLSGQCKILHAHLQVATRRSIASQQGDLRIQISLDDGSLEYGMRYDNRNGGFNRVTTHPETGQNLNEFKLPLWKEVLSLAEEAAINFLPIRTLGWDISITDKGLKILEANTHPYTPPNLFEPKEKFIKSLLDT